MKLFKLLFTVLACIALLALGVYFWYYRGVLWPLITVTFIVGFFLISSYSRKKKYELLETVRNGKTKKARSEARAKLLPDDDLSGMTYLLFQCIACDRIFHEQDSTLKMQWNMYSSGATHMCDRSIRCPHCNHQAHISEWYDYNKDLNGDMSGKKKTGTKKKSSTKRESSTKKNLDQNTIELLEKVRNGKTKKSRLAARAQLVPAEDSSGMGYILLQCTSCDAVFFHNDTNLHMQWKMISGGGTLMGGLTIHCPACRHQAHIKEWYDSSKDLNRDL